MRTCRTSTFLISASNHIWNSRPTRQLNGLFFTRLIPSHKSSGQKAAERTSSGIQLQNTLSKTNWGEPFWRSKRLDLLIVASICSPSTLTKCKIRVVLPFVSQVSRELLCVFIVLFFKSWFVLYTSAIDKPIVKAHTDSHSKAVHFNERFNVGCQILAYPESDVKLFFRECLPQNPCATTWSQLPLNQTFWPVNS